MAVKYVRVVLAYNVEDEILLQVALENLIEADTYGAPFQGVQGAHVSAPYDDRESACNAPFVNQPPMTEEESTQFTETALAFERQMKEYYSD